MGTIWVTRLLTGGAFGQLAFLQAVVAFLVGIAVLGLNTAITKTAAAARAKDLSETGRLIGHATRTVLISSAVLTIALLALRTPLARILDSPDLSNQIALASLTVVAGATTIITTGALIGLEAFRAVATVAAGRGVLTAVLTVVGAASKGLDGAIIGWAAAECLAAGGGLYALARACRLSGVKISVGEPEQSWRALRPIAIPALVSTVAVGFSLVFGQHLLAGQPFGFQEVAEFNLAYRWSLAVLFIPSSIAPVLLPLLSNLRAAGASHSFRRLFRTNLWLTVLLTAIPAAALISMRDVVLGLSGSEYVTGSATFVVLMIATIPIALNGVLSQTVLSLDAIRAWLLSDLALAVAVIGVAWVLIPTVESTGLALAYAFGYMISCVVLIIPTVSRTRAFEIDAIEETG